MIQLLKEYEGNFEAQEVIRILAYTNESLFLTGKAGTGKSTLLKALTHHTKKNYIILASTGVAALNVGGQTIHSFLRIEPRPYLPNDRDIQDLSEEKKEVLRKLDLIIIDEISMVRSDLMQAIDLTLRKNLQSPHPFAKKQLLLIGDLFQLPPVVNSKNLGESDIIEHNYRTPYFFSSLALENGYNYHIIELKKIYRQSDPRFINVLNAVRINAVNTGHLQVLNERYLPTYESKEDNFEITLCTTKAGSENINKLKLSALDTALTSYIALITGDFLIDKRASRLPADMELHLKETAQVMFLKNDGEKRWVNGSIGKVISMDTDSLEIEMDSGGTHMVERALWESIEYRWNKKEEKIDKIVTGTFQQFPLKLAWAVTIHKSQGQTFQNTIIDMGTGAFASGQTYVALSRCTTLEGIKLKRRITIRDIISDPRINTYLQGKNNTKMEKERYEAIINGLQAKVGNAELNAQATKKIAELELKNKTLNETIYKDVEEIRLLNATIYKSDVLNNKLQKEVSDLEIVRKHLIKKLEIALENNPSKEEVNFLISKINRLENVKALLIIFIILLIAASVLFFLNEQFKR